MKTTATRCVEIFATCPHCGDEITHIPDDITAISEENPEEILCQRCETTFEVIKVLSDAATDNCNHTQHNSKMVLLGEATTIGELKKMIENYPNKTSFGFRNQPMQKLYEISDSDMICVAFQE